jgi:alkylated DNA repair dioxygenase AlkB
MYGNIRKTPRHTWCFGRFHQEIVKYRGKQFKTELFPEWLVEEKFGFKTNACILNAYQNAEDVHADDEKFLEEKTVVSLSFGHAREFCMRDKQFIHKMNLQNNSILVMKDAIEHCLPACKVPVKTRFNITFRRVASEKGMGNYYYYNRGFDFIKSSNCL